jgi:hypothetical protein
MDDQLWVALSLQRPLVLVEAVVSESMRGRRERGVRPSRAACPSRIGGPQLTTVPGKAGLMNEYLYFQTDRQTDRQTDGWTVGQTDRQMDRWTDGRTDRRADGRSDSSMDVETGMAWG